MGRKLNDGVDPGPPPLRDCTSARTEGFTPGPWAIAGAAMVIALVSITWTTVLPSIGAPLSPTQLDAGQGVLDIAVQAAAAGVIARAAFSMCGRTRMAWATFAAGAALGSVGTAVRVSSVLSGSEGLGAASEAIWATALGLTLAGLVLLPASALRSGKVRRTDTGILIIAATSLVWILPAHPNLGLQEFRLLQAATTVTLIVAIGVLARCRPDSHGEITLAVGAISAIGLRLLILPPPPSGYPAAVRLADAATSAAFVVMAAAGLRLRGPLRAPSRRAEDHDRLISLPEVATVLTLAMLAAYSQLGGSLLVSVVLGGMIVLLALARLFQLSSEQRSLRRSLRDTAARLHSEARVDDLTGFGNRLSLEEHLASIAACTRRSTGPSAAVMFVDIDHFKRYNDALGHAVGDSLLIEVARRIEASSESDVFRAGGDEFIVVATGCSTDEAEELAERMVKAMDPAVEVNGHELDVSVSVGWSHMDPDRAVRFAELVKQADLALYEAKVLGRGRQHRFAPELAARVSSQRQARLGLERALEAGDVDVRFEPVVTLDDRSLAGLTARLWWESDDIGTVGPDMIAELTSSGGPLVAMVETLLDSVCSALADTAETSEPTPWVGFALARAHLLHPAAMDMVVERLGSASIDASRVRIEVAEQVVVDSHVAAALDRIRSTGAELSVEHFGAGPPSLLRLSAYPATSICIDKSFVEGICHEGTDTIIMSALASLAIELDLQMSADGVSSENQVSELVELGFTTARGPLFRSDFSCSRLGVTRSRRAVV